MQFCKSVKGGSEHCFLNYLIPEMLFAKGVNFFFLIMLAFCACVRLRFCVVITQVGHMQGRVGLGVWLFFIWYSCTLCLSILCCCGQSIFCQQFATAVHN